MGVELAQKRLTKILEDLNLELQALYSQGVLNRADIEKIRNQAKVSNDALLQTISSQSFGSSTRDKVLMALLDDFENSTKRYIEAAVGRRGDRALLIYKLNGVDANLLSGSPDNHDLRKSMKAAMTATREYILLSLPQTGKAFGPKIDVNQVLRNYNQVLTRLMHELDVSEDIRLVE